MPRHEMRTAILLPARFIVLGAEWPLFAPARGIHAVGGNAERNKVILGSLGAAFTEANVVFRRATLIAMALDGHADLRIRAQEFRGLCQVSAGVATNIGFVEVKVGVLHVLLEQFTQALVCGRRSFHGRRAHGDACVRGCGAARPGRGDGEGRRFRWLAGVEPCAVTFPTPGSMSRSVAFVDVQLSVTVSPLFTELGEAFSVTVGCAVGCGAACVGGRLATCFLQPPARAMKATTPSKQSQLSQTTILHLLPPSASLPGLSR